MQLLERNPKTKPTMVISQWPAASYRCHILLVSRGGGIATAAGNLQWSLSMVICHCSSIVVFLVASHFQSANCSGKVVVRKVPINLQCKDRQFQSAGGFFILKGLFIVLLRYSH
jgi:hypothetical protein